MECNQCGDDAVYKISEGLFCHPCLGTHMIDNYGYMLDLTEDFEDEDGDSNPGTEESQRS